MSADQITLIPHCTAYLDHISMREYLSRVTVAKQPLDQQSGFRSRNPRRWSDMLVDTAELPKEAGAKMLLRHRSTARCERSIRWFHVDDE